MKIRTLLLIITVLVAGTVSLSAQEFLLPIGENVDRREAEVALNLGNLSGWWIDGSFSYRPSMGPLESVIETRLKDLARNLTPPAGSESDTYWWGIIVEPGPFAYSPDFKLQHSNDTWVIPEEVLDVELEYGEVTVTLTGVTKVEIEVRGDNRTERFSSDGSEAGDPCYIQAVDRDLKIGLVSLVREYVNPKYRVPWVTEGEVTLWEGEDRKAVFNILNGYLLEASDPPPTFLETLRALPVPLSPPRITSMTREGNTTTITVAGSSNSAITVEWKEKLGDDWQAISYATPLSLNGSGTGTFTHVSATTSGFYRVSAHGSAVERKAVKPASSP